MGGGAYPSAVATGASPTSGAATGTTAYSPNGSALRDGIIETANAIGADPLDLATAISYETAGTFDPLKKGPTTQHGQHQGLIQFGEPQAQKFGVDWSDPLGSQLGANGAVANYFRASGFKPGMSGLDLYSTINAGSPGRYSASDANNGGAPGDVRDKWENQMQGHRQKALALLGGGSAGVDYTPTGAIPAKTPQEAIQSASPVADPDGLFAPGADVSAADLAFARQASGPEIPVAGGATFGGPELVHDGQGMRYVDEGAQRAANPPMPYNGAGASIDGYSAASAPAQNNFNDRWNAGAIDQTQTGSVPAFSAQPAAQVGQVEPSSELLRQNDAMWGGALAPQGQAPQQSANVTGYFPPAPSADAPAMGSFATMGAPQQQGGSMQQLLEAASDPWMSQAQRGIIGSIIENRMSQNDPIRQLQMQKLQADIAKTRRGDDETFFGNVIKGYDEKGNPTYYQTGNKGGFKRVALPVGFRPENRLEKVDLGTHWLVKDTTTGEERSIPKENYQEAFDKGAGSAAGKSQSEAQGALPALQSQVEQMSSKIDDVLNDPNLSGSVGNVWGRLPSYSQGAIDFDKKVEQIKGQVFLQARQFLKGQGQITDFESGRAEAAMAQLDQAQSEEQFKAALTELKSAIHSGYEKARLSAGGGNTSQPQTAPNAPIDDLLKKYGG